MADLQQDNPASDAWRFNARVFLVREWPYLLVLSLAILGIAYTSFAKTPITTYWIVLAPFIGLVCVVTRWRDAENREQRLHLIWTQALHWAAVLVAMHLMFVVDVSRMMNADASALAALTVLALGPLRLAFTSQHGASVWSAPFWRSGFQPSRGSSNQRYFFCWLRLSSWRPLHHFSGAADDRLNIQRQHENETAALRDVAGSAFINFALTQTRAHDSCEHSLSTCSAKRRHSAQVVHTHA